MANTISILITAKDNASQVLKGVDDSIQKSTQSVQKQAGVISTVQQNWTSYAALAAGAGLATHGLIGEMNTSINSANRLQSALTGLNSVARAFGQDATAAKTAAQTLAKDGLLTVADAATGLKNLLASGFSLDQAVTLMTRFKDSAAFGRQSALSFGQAVSSATEGIKNGNSILVDNAGVTKNLSVILTEAGYSAQDLGLATQDAGIRQALFNGILKETNPQLGDAARLAGQAAGQQAQLAAQSEVLRQQIGTALQPALLALLQTVTPIITQIAGWVSQNPQLASTLIIGTTAVMGLTAAAGTLALTIAGLAPVFALMKVTAIASIGAVSAAWGGMAALVMSPIAMPAIAVAAAIAALIAVKNAAQEAHREINAAQAAADSAHNSNMSTLQSAQAKRKSGEWSEAEYQRIVQSISGRATGGPMAANTPYLVGERGPELFTPSTAGNMLNASDTAAGGVTNILSGTFNFHTAEAVNQFFDTIDKTQRLSRVGMK